MPQLDLLTALSSNRQADREMGKDGPSPPATQEAANVEAAAQAFAVGGAPRLGCPAPPLSPSCLCPISLAAHPHPKLLLSKPLGGPTPRGGGSY